MTADLKDVLVHAIQVAERTIKTPKEERTSKEFAEVAVHFAIKAEEAGVELRRPIPNEIGREVFQTWEQEYLEMIKDKPSLTWRDWGNILSWAQTARLTFIERK